MSRKTGNNEENAMNKEENIMNNTTNENNENNENKAIATIGVFAKSLNDRLSQILNAGTNAIMKVEGETELAVLTVQLKHKLASGATSLTITTPSTIESVERLQKLEEVEKLTPSIKCVELAKIADDVDSELKMSVETFAYSVFGITKTTANQYVRIGKYFYNEEGGMKGNLPFLNTSQLIPLLARLTYADDEKKVLSDNPIRWIEQAFMPNENGNSLLHPTDSASDIKKALKSYDSGILDIHGECHKSEEQIQAIKAQNKANRKTNEKNTGNATSNESDENSTPYGAFLFSLGQLITDADSVVASYKEAKDDINFDVASKLSIQMEIIAKAIGEISSIIADID